MEERKWITNLIDNQTCDEWWYYYYEPFVLPYSYLCGFANNDNIHASNPIVYLPLLSKFPYFSTTLKNHLNLSPTIF